MPQRLDVGSVTAGDGPERLQGDQRQLRSPDRRPRPARSRAGAADGDPPLRHLRALRGRRVHRRPGRMRRGRGRAQAARAPAGRRRSRVRSASGYDADDSRSAPAPPCSRRTATATKRCWPPPTAGCTSDKGAAQAIRRPGSSLRRAPTVTPDDLRASSRPATKDLRRAPCAGTLVPCQPSRCRLAHSPRLPRDRVCSRSTSAACRSRFCQDRPS